MHNIEIDVNMVDHATQKKTQTPCQNTGPLSYSLVVSTFHFFEQDVRSSQYLVTESPAATLSSVLTSLSYG